MAENSKIEWTDATWNPVRGCSRLSPGCGGANHQGGCYAEKIAARFSAPGQPFHGFAERTEHGGRWTGRMALVPELLDQPLRWRKPRRIFVNSMSDLFHENLPDEAIDKVFAVMALAPQHTFQVLTKRADRMREYFAERWQGTPAQRIKLGNDIIDMPAGPETGREHQIDLVLDGMVSEVGLADPDNDDHWTADGECKARQFTWPLPNVWLGVSVEDQERADERIPDLLATPAAVRFLSCEPLLGPVDLERWTRIAWQCSRCRAYFAGSHEPSCPQCGQLGGWSGSHAFNPKGGQVGSGIDWIIAGGESGPRARPSELGWFRSLRDQCAEAGVPFFFKQWGEYGPVEITHAEFAAPAEKHVGERWIGKDDNHVTVMRRVGKKAASATLDGKLHREFPTWMS